MTILLTSHYLDEMDALCDRVAIIDNGEVSTVSEPEQLKRQLAADVIVVRLVEDSERGQRLLEAVSGVKQVELVGEGLRLTVTDAVTAVPEVLRTLLDSGLRPIGVEVLRPTLEDAFLAVANRPVPDGSQAEVLS